MSRWRLAPGVRRLGDRRLAGGRPFRIVRLSPAGDEVLAGVLGTDTRPDAGTPAGRLVRRLTEGGLLLPPVGSPRRPDDVTVVVPALSDPAPVLELLDSVPAGVPVVVVDDGSPRPLAGSLAGRPGVTVVRHERPIGPAQSRNDGAAVADRAWIAFVDADITAGPDWLDRLRGQAEDGVVAVAPRVASTPGPGLAGLIETRSGGLDLGPVAGEVRLAGPLTYLPSAALLVRRDAFVAAGGFDAGLTVAEDVDLVWRLLRVGRVRYEPAVTVRHSPRRGAGAVLRRRFAYGTGAALIDERHPGTLRHAEVSGLALVPWLAGLALGLRAGAVVGLAAVAAAPARLPEVPSDEAVRLVARGQLNALRTLGRWLVRPMWPVTALAFWALPGRRRALAAAVGLGLTSLVGPDESGSTGSATRLTTGAARLTAGTLDDLAYSLGVWTGCLRRGRLSPLALRVHVPPRVSRRRSR
jgi:mycofactocin system glycosyltransferase